MLYEQNKNYSKHLNILLPSRCVVVRDFCFVFDVFKATLISLAYEPCVCVYGCVSLSKVTQIQAMESQRHLSIVGHGSAYVDGEQTIANCI